MDAQWLHMHGRALDGKMPSQTLPQYAPLPQSTQRKPAEACCLPYQLGGGFALDPLRSQHIQQQSPLQGRRLLLCTWLWRLRVLCMLCCPVLLFSFHCR